jgi:phthiocerol/phenolphthiocerol synthesis type-I polyketide synthase E
MAGGNETEMYDEFDEIDEIEGVAITGMSARFPDANNVAKFWENLCAGVESITLFSVEELVEAGANPAEVNMADYVRASPILQDIDLFDAAFFNVPPSEAEFLDPQHRFFLECAWEALEDAGYDPGTYDGWIGTFGGAGGAIYLLNNLWPNRYLLPSSGGSLPITLANKGDFLTTRVSYKLNLKGPSLNVQTACSTSLVATHLACQSLLNYQCDMALAGGATITVPRGYHCQEGFLSPDGHCRPFDAQARGTIFGSGVGVVVLKRLTDALADGDHIYAVIKGTAINNDGSLKVGFTAPGLEGQMQAIAMAHQSAGIDPETISYIETHGTGTSLGDPIEIEALTLAFRARTDKKQFCAIGSVKGNIGHTDSAAGVAGLIKTALAFKHKILPPSINYETPNPKIDFANSPFYVNTGLREWKTDEEPRRAGVSAFGMGGTNAHAVLEEAPEVEPSSESRRYQQIVLSARTETALERMTDNLAAHLQANPDSRLADVAYTLHVGRQAFENRRMVVCQTLADAIVALQERDPKRVLTGAQVQPERPVAFMFSGQGAQHVNMGRDLYHQEASFREQVNTCAELLEPHLGLDLRDVLYPAEADAEKAAEQLNQTWLTQPALFVIEYALAQLWISWGVRPQAMIGHSIGEYVAACLAGVFGLEDGLALVAARGRLMQSMPSGSMLSVPLAEADVQSLLNDALTVATINGPSRCVVAGPTEAIVALEQQLAEEGIACRRLHTSHAFHSAMMDPILEPFGKEVRRVQLRAPQIPYVSNVSGAWITPAEATDPVYWAQHLRQAVRFSDGVSVLAQIPEQVLLEVGPGRTLRTLAQRHPDRPAEQVVLSSMRHPQDVMDDGAFLLQSMGQLWLTGVLIDWSAFYQGERRLRLSLPTYPFERKRYWIEPMEDSLAQSVSLFKNPNIANWFYVPSWKRTMPPVQESQETESRWLLFGDGDGLSAKLAQQLRAQGYQVVTVLAGEEFTANGDMYTIHPAHRDDYETLLTTLDERDQVPTHIVHLWNVAPLDASAADFTEKALQRSFYSLLFLAQAIGAKSLSQNLQLAVLSSNMQKVASDEVVCPEKATLLGPCKVIPQEYPNIICRSVDIVLPEAGSEQEAQLVEQLIAELKTSAPDSIIAYRGYDRLVQTYELAPLAELKGEGNCKLREGGVYLITGGLGGIGLTLAEHLAQTVQARLVLTSRSHFPEPEAREQWLATHDPQDRTSLRIRTVQALEALGAEVMVVQADVTDRVRMEAGVRAACERFGTVHGVIHSAGLPGAGVMQLKAEEIAASVLMPKVQGTRVLEAIFQDISLDFLVLCSSLASATGGLGQVDYCAANAFMDAFAHARNGRNGTMTVSVNWDAWAKVGMAVNTAPTYTASRVERTLQVTKVDHPILDSSYRETDERTIYQMELSPAEHWVLSEHKLLGIPTVPGTTHLELARAAFLDRTQSTNLEIHEAIFLVPLMVSEGDSKEAQLILEERGEEFEFQVRSKAGIVASGETRWQTHVMGKMTHMTDATPQWRDVEAIRARCSVSEVVITTEDIENSISREGGFLKFGPRWYSLKYVNVGDDEGIAWIELDEEFWFDLEGFKLHPALLDIATSFFVAMIGTEILYLPLSYKRAHIYGSLPGKFYSYVCRKPDSKVGEETMAVRVTLLDEQGRVVVDVEEFTMARVEETAASRLRGSVDQDAAGKAQPGTTTDERYQRDFSNAILPEEGIEAFRRILVRNRLPQIAVSTRHLPTLIQRAKESTPERLLEQAAQVETSEAKHPRPNLQTPYVAPRNEVEEKLAAIWGRLLGIEQVGVHDNFFELGGDSVMGIQVVARVREAGFHVDPEQLFQNQTIAELAGVLQPPLTTAEKVALPLTSYQQRLLKRDVHEPHVVVLELGQRLDPTMLEQAIVLVCAHHDALQLRFTQKGDGWHQTFEAQPGVGAVSTVDLTALSPNEHGEAIAAEIVRLQRGFRAAEPPLLRATYLQLGAAFLDRLLLAVTPLSADVAALPILLEDLHTAYQQVTQATDGQLLRPTATFADWMARVARYARSDELEQQTYWRHIADQEVHLLPTDTQRSAAAAGMTRLVTVRLAPEQTRQLQELPDRYYIQPEEVVLTALAQVLTRWGGHNALLIGLSHFQRGPVFADLDTSRVVGCLRVEYPLYLDVPATEELDTVLKSVKEQARQAPQYGLGYSILRVTDETLTLEPSVTFTCHPPLLDHSLFRVVDVHISENRPDKQIHLSAGTVKGQLQLDWHYNTNSYRKTTITRLSHDLIATLQTLIEHCWQSGTVQFTPSDFPEAGLDQGTLDQFLATLGKKE